MATLKLKSPPRPGPRQRPPLRGPGVAPRPLTRGPRPEAPEPRPAERPPAEAPRGFDDRGRGFDRPRYDPRGPGPGRQAPEGPGARRPGFDDRAGNRPDPYRPFQPGRDQGRPDAPAAHGPGRGDAFAGPARRDASQGPGQAPRANAPDREPRWGPWNDDRRPRGPGDRAAGFDREARDPAQAHDRFPARPAARPEPVWDHRPPPGPGRPGRPGLQRPGPLPTPQQTIGPRLSKRISELGLASRREADEWIPRGWVRVDGRIVSTLGARVHPDAVITLDPRAQSEQASRITVLLHKPLGLVSGQAEDGHEPAITLVTAENQWQGDRSGRTFSPEHLRWLAPAGRLDLDSTGLLVLTQDGRVARRLVGEEHAVAKTYRVRIEPLPGHGPIDDAALARMRHGLELDGEPLLPAEVERLAEGELRIVLQEGRKRQIRRMAEAVGQRVVELVRVAIGGIELGDLPPGRWRYLRDDESFT